MSEKEPEITEPLAAFLISLAVTIHALDPEHPTGKKQKMFLEKLASFVDDALEQSGPFPLSDSDRRELLCILEALVHRVHDPAVVDHVQTLKKHDLI